VTQQEIRKNIRAASNKSILRQQLELLAEHSRTHGIDQIPECSAAMAQIYQELVRTERVSKLTALLFFGISFDFLYGVSVKVINLLRRK